MRDLNKNAVNAGLLNENFKSSCFAKSNLCHFL